MKRTVKKPLVLTEPLIESPEETKGKTISIYLNAESLRYVDQLCQLFKAGRSEVIQQMIVQTKQASLAILPMLGGDKSPLAEVLKKMALGES
jgi:hypothetical protein